MFERFNEDSRRSIFFAQYEAGVNGSEIIECGHLLLGLLKEEKRFHDFFPDLQDFSAEKIRSR